MSRAKTKRVGTDVVDLSTGEILEIPGLPNPKDIDRTQPLTDEQYNLIAKLPENEKNKYTTGFDSSNWTEAQIMKHYRNEHFGEVRYYSSGGGGKGTPTPPTRK